MLVKARGSWFISMICIISMLGTKLKDFNAAIANFQPDIEAVRREVEEYAKQFPTIGFEKTSMKYKD
mgnify:FL=1